MELVVREGEVVPVMWWGVMYAGCWLVLIASLVTAWCARGWEK